MKHIGYIVRKIFKRENGRTKWHGMVAYANVHPGWSFELHESSPDTVYSGKQTYLKL